MRNLSEPSILTSNKLQLSYDNKTMIIKECSFDIKLKDIVIITGVSGSGKSTLLKSLYGGLKIKHGSLNINGFDMKNISKQHLLDHRRQLGIIFQDYKLVNEWSVYKNIELPLMLKGVKSGLRDAQVEKLLSHVKLELRKSKYPLELSGGEQQRVAVARAIGHNPKIILADEPTGNLDKYSSEVIWELLQNVNEALDITTIIVTHRIPENLFTSFRHFYLENGVLYDDS